VDDDPAFVDVTASLLEREHGALSVSTATGAAEGLDRLREEGIDCVVSDYGMPRTNGLEFLRLVREEHPELPFILFTADGSEGIASEAISAGVTDYLRKGHGTEQYTVLANRIDNAVAQYRAERAVRRTQGRFKRLIERSTDVVSIVDADATFEYLTPSAERVLGYSPEELIGEVGFDYLHPDDRTEATERFARIVGRPGTIATLEFRFEHGNGEWTWLEARARNLTDEPLIDGVVVHTRDVTERKRRERELARQNERLESVVNAVSHDLRNPLNVAEARLELARRTGDTEQFERVGEAHDRIAQITDDLVALARHGEAVEEPEPVGLEAVSESAWRSVETRAATLHVERGGTVRADRSRLQRLLENLFHNAVEHGRRDGTVWIGRLETGFYVEDDGPGIPADEREEAFESGYSTDEDGTGFGLAIVGEVVQAHGWEIAVTEGREGGARFEVTGSEAA
jgi:PAS domain S-box-containing protein